MTNITSSNIKYKACDNKCEYKMYYEKDQINSTNHKNYILATPQTGFGSKSVTYAGKTYSLISIMIVQPSIHFYNDNKTIGEIIINHSILNSSNSNALNVCIPINNANNLSKGSAIISSIINTTKTRGPSTSNIAPFSIMEIIPAETFYTYISNNNTTNIVFDLKYAININDKTTDILTTLTNYETPNIDDYTTHDDIFISKNPPINGSIGSDILYDCMLVDEGESENMLVTKNNFSTNSGLSPSTITMIWTLLTIFIILLLCVGIIIILKLMTGATNFSEISNSFTKNFTPKNN